MDKISTVFSFHTLDSDKNFHIGHGQHCSVSDRYRRAKPERITKMMLAEA